MTQQRRFAKEFEEEAPRLHKPGTVRKTSRRMTQCLSTKPGQVHGRHLACREPDWTEAPTISLTQKYASSVPVLENPYRLCHHERQSNTISGLLS
jgi:hypothetical protein